MKIPCEIIADLLPLYHDGVCNESSKKLVEEHLAECSACRVMLKRISSDTLDNRIRAERENVMEHHKNAVKRKTFFWGITIAVVILTVMLLVDALYRGDEWLSIITIIPALYGVSVALFSVNRHMKANALIRAGSCVILGALLLAVCLTIFDLMSEGVLHLRFSNANLSAWNDLTTLDANINLLVFLTCGIVGGLLLIAGWFRKKKR